jgi:hypothetical protein
MNPTYIIVKLNQEFQHVPMKFYYVIKKFQMNFDMPILSRLFALLFV